VSFAEPAALLMLTALLPLAVLLGASYRRGVRDLSHFVTLRPAPPLRGGLAALSSAGARTRLSAADPRKVFLFKRFFDGLFTCVALAAIVLAIAGVRWGEGVVEEPRIGAEVVLIIDLSRSMMATDVEPTRLARAIGTLNAIVEATPAGRFALVAFGDAPYLLVPFTDDRIAIAQNLNALGDSNLAGSNLAAALVFATELTGRAGSGRTLLLLSDGEANGADPLVAARVVADKGVSIVAVSVGTVSGSRLATGDGEVVTSANPELLRQLAEVSGGLFAGLGAEAEQIEAVTAFLAGASQTADGRSFRFEPVQRYPLLVAVGVVALVLGQLTRRVRWHELF